MKIFYFDVETTGLDAKDNDIITIAYMIEIDGDIKLTKYLKLQPFNYENISTKALEVNGITLEELKTFIKPEDAYHELIVDMSMFCDKYNRNDKYTPAGYNARFDIDFLSHFFKKNNDQYLGSFFNWKTVDPLSILYFNHFKEEINLVNYKLETVCKHYGIEIEAHDALSDIKATHSLIEILKKPIKQ